jgi:GntR family transcriptional regulator
MVDDLPTAIHRSALPAALVERIGLTREIAANPQFSLYARLERSGLVVERAVERLRARSASTGETGLLDLEAGGAVMEVRRRSYASDGSLLDVVDAVYDARRYSYEARILRGHDKGSAASTNEADKETGDAEQADDARAYGPRLGPWNDARRGPGG